MTVPEPCVLPQRPAAATPVTPSPDRILDAPLPQLLADSHAEIIPSSITDRAFLGAVMQHRKSGEITLTMPTGRSELEHDTMARYLLAQVFGVDLPKLPAPFVTSVI